MILTSQGHLSTAGGQEGYLSIASTSGGYPFDSAEMTLLYFSLKIVPGHSEKQPGTIFTHNSMQQFSHTLIDPHVLSDIKCAVKRDTVGAGAEV